MSFDKDYPNRKDKRRPYHGSKRFDKSCRPGGDCPRCEGGRKYKNRLEELDEEEYDGNVSNEDSSNGRN